jgi:hypothetical protein
MVECMKQVTLSIPDKKYLTFMELINNLGYVKSMPANDGPSKEQVLQDIKDAVDEVNLIKAGKLKGIPAKDLFNEL